MSVASSIPTSALILPKTVATAHFSNAVGSINNMPAGLHNETPYKWIAAASSLNGSHVIAVDHSTIFLSRDYGSTWTTQGPKGSWSAVAISRDGRHLVVAGGAKGKIYVSSDSGLNWTPSGPAENWVSVAASQDGKNLVAAVGSGKIYTSSDFGSTWVAHSPTRLWFSVASSGNGKFLIASIHDFSPNTNTIYTSNDFGVTWTPQNFTLDCLSVTSSIDGKHLAIYSNHMDAQGGNEVYASSDFGRTWTLQTSVGSWGTLVASSDGSHMLTLDGGGGITNSSSDFGATWSTHEPLSNSNGDPNNFQFTPVALSGDGSHLVVFEYGYTIHTSADFGMKWKSYDLVHDWTSVTTSFDGKRLVAIGNRNGDGMIYTSSNFGITWKQQISSGSGPLNHVVSSKDGSHLATTAVKGQIYISTDFGENWTPSGPIGWWTSITSSSDGRYLAATRSETDAQNIYTSNDFGATWVPKGPLGYWESVSSSSDGRNLFACTRGLGGSGRDPGRILTSKDFGLTWTFRYSTKSFCNFSASSPDGKRLYGLSGSPYFYTTINGGLRWALNTLAKDAFAIASSSDGKHIVALSSKYSKNSSTYQIYISEDSGRKWILRNSSDHYWKSVVSSYDGSRLVLVEGNGQIYTSNDYGRSWVARIAP